MFVNLHGSVLAVCLVRAVRFRASTSLFVSPLVLLLSPQLVFAHSDLGSRSMSPPILSGSVLLPQSFRISDLPPSLLPLILQLLPPRDKLTQLTHLSHSFPPLTPTAFHYSHITFTEDVTRAVSCSKHLRHVLSGLYSASFLLVGSSSDSHHRVDLTPFLQLLTPASPTAPSLFSSLHVLAIALPSECSEADKAAVSSLFPSPAAFPSLHSLFMRWSIHLPASFTSSLQHLPSLRHLKLVASIDDLSPIAVLAVDTLDLTDTFVYQSPALVDDDTNTDVVPLPACRTLLMGGGLGTDYLLTAVAAARMKHEHPRSLAVGSDVSGRLGLQHLSISPNCVVSPERLLTLLSFSSLTSLVLPQLTYVEQDDFLSAAATGLPLLTRLSMVGVHLHVSDDQAVISLCPALLSFFVSFSGQLTSIAVHQCRTLSAGAVEQLLCCVLRCRRLTHISVSLDDFTRTVQDDGHGNAEVREPVTLSGADRAVHLPDNFILDNVQTLNLYLPQLDLPATELIRLLSMCRLMQDFTLATATVDVGVVSVLAQHCPLVRRIHVQSGNVDMFTDQQAVSSVVSLTSHQRRHSSAPPLPLFPHLRVLYLDNTLPSNRQYEVSIDPRMPTALVELLAHHAPLIRCLTCPVTFDLPHLHTLSALSLLQWLCVRYGRRLDISGQKTCALVERFCLPRREYSWPRSQYWRTVADVAAWRWQLSVCAAGQSDAQSACACLGNVESRWEEWIDEETAEEPAHDRPVTEGKYARGWPCLDHRFVRTRVFEGGHTGREALHAEVDRQLAARQRPDSGCWKIIGRMCCKATR